MFCGIIRNYYISMILINNYHHVIFNAIISIIIMLTVIILHDVNYVIIIIKAYPEIFERYYKSLFFHYLMQVNRYR